MARRATNGIWGRAEQWATERPLWFGLVTAAGVAIAAVLFLPVGYAALLGGLWFLLQGVTKEAIRRERARHDR